MFTKKSILRSKPAKLLVWIMTFMLAVMPVQPARALPNGQNVTHGDVTFYTVGNSMVVVQQSGSAIVNYNSFNIDSPESVRFIQPDASAAILNRVTGGGSSTIAGDMSANGRVYLINPNGILFTSSSHVNVGALVASGMNMSDDDFLSGTMYFSGGGGSVVNEGSLNGRRVYLVGGNVENRGSISAGSVVLAAGQQSVLIDRAAGGEIRLVIDGDTTLADKATNRFSIAAAVSNAEAQAASAGGTNSQGGAVADATAQAGNQIAAAGGAASTNGVANPAAAGFTLNGTNGAALPLPAPPAIAEVPTSNTVVATAMVTNGIVENWGTITAQHATNDTENPGQGGDVTLGGVRVGQYGTINANGTDGNGGVVNILATQVIIMSSNSVTTADAGLNGKGGDVIIISEQGLYMDGGSLVTAHGGSQSGDGGYIETSGYMQTVLHGETSTTAPHGQGGMYYIDPPNFYIDDEGDREDCNFLGFDCTYTVAFDSGLNRIVPTQSPGYMDTGTMQELMDEHGAMAIQTAGVGGSGSGQILVENSINYDGVGGNGTFLLDAGGNLFMNGNLYDSSGGGDKVNVYLVANGQVQINNNITSQGGNIVIVSGQTTSDGAAFIFGTSTLNSGGGAITIASQNNAQVQIYGNVNAGGGEVATAASSEMFMDGSISGSRVTVQGTYVEQSGNINASQDIVVQATSSSINMGSGASATSSGGDVLYNAAYEANVTGLNAPAGTTVVVGRYITDAGDSSVDVAGNRVMLFATNGAIGAGNALEMSAGTVAGFASSGGINLTEVSSGGGITVGVVPTVSISAAGPTGSVLNTIFINAFTGLVAAGTGNINLTAQNGSITVDGHVVEANVGSVSLNAQGAGNDVTINDTVFASNGTVNITAADSVFQNGTLATARGGNLIVNAAGGSIVMAAGEIGFAGSGQIRYNAGQNITADSIITSNGNVSVIAGNNITQNSNIITLANGTVDVQAGGSITMKNGSLAVSGNNNIRYSAGGNVTLSGLIATQGNITVTSTSGSILDGGDAYPELVAHKVQLSAQNGHIGTVGGGANAIEMGASNIAARASTGINIAVGGNMTIDTVGAINVNRVNLDGSVSSVAGSSMSGLTTTGNGTILAVGNGRITVAQPVTAGGSGNILLANTTPTNGTKNDIFMNNTVNSGSGNITVSAGNSLRQGVNGDINTAGGDVVAVAQSGDIAMSNGARTATSGGNIMYVAETNLIVGSLDAGSGQISAVALKGSILDGGDAHKDFVGAGVQLIAISGSVGRAANKLDTDIGVLSAYAGSGGVYVTEDNNLTIGTVGPVNVDLVTTNGLTSPTNTPALSGIIASNGLIDVNTIAGSITVTSQVLNINSGSITLDANGGGADINVRGLIYTFNGNITLTADHNITQSTNIISGGTGFINVDAANSIFMTNNALTFDAIGNIRYNGGGNVEVASIITSNGYITVQAGNSVFQDSNLVSLAGGTLDVEANVGSIVMKNGALGVAGAGNIRYEANQNVVLGGLIATQNDVSVIADYGNITDAGEAFPNIVASNAQLWATRGSIGQLGAVSPTNDRLEIGVSTIAAVSGKGGMNLGFGGTNIIIGTVGPIGVFHVQSNGSVTPIGGDTLSGLTATGGGSIVASALTPMTVQDIVQVEQGGSILLAVQTGLLQRLTINTNVIAQAGNITLFSGGDMVQNVGGDVITEGGDIVAVTKGGPLTMVDGVRAISGSGDIAYISSTNLYLAGLQTDTGTVVAVTFTGDIIDAGDTFVNVAAPSVQFFTLNGSVGSSANRIETDVNNLAGLSQNGDIYIFEDDNLTIANVGPVNLSVVKLDATIGLTNTPAFNGAIATNGSVIIDTLAGSITVSGIVASLSAGNVRLSANGGGSDLNIQNSVVANNGNISLLAANSIIQNTSVVVQTAGSIDVEATAGSIFMTDSGLTFNNLGNIGYQALGDVTLGSLIATQGAVSVISTLGSILDGGDSLPEIIAVQAELFATNGSIGVLGPGIENPLEVGIGTVAAVAGEGGINMINGGDVTVGTVPAVTVNRILPDNSTNPITSPALSGFTTINNGTIVFASVGQMTVNDAIAADGTGNVLLATQTGVVNSVLFGAQTVFNAPVTSSNGYISILSGQTMFQNSNGDFSTFGGDVSAVTFDGPIVMENGALTESHGGNILYTAATNFFIGGLDAGTGLVAAIALDGSIFDSGDAYTNVVAHAAQFIAKNGGVGTTTNGIETTVDQLAAFAANGSVKITESDNVTIGAVGPVNVKVVGFDGTTATTNSPILSGIIATNGHILVDTVDGSITITSTVANAGTGNIWLDANGANSDIVVSNLVLAANGNITLNADHSIQQYDDMISAGIGTIDVEAFTGSIFMADGPLAIANNGNIRYAAEQDVTISGLISPSNTIDVISRSGSILDAGDAHSDVISPYAMFQAGNGVGTAANPIDTVLAVVSARSGNGGVNIDNKGLTIVQTVPTVTVQRVMSDGSTTSITDVAMSDIVTTNNGGVELSSLDGTIIISDGFAPSNHVGIHADGTGTICVVANGTNSSLIVDSDVTSGTGDISLIADKSVIINSNATEISTSGRGSIALWADQDKDGNGDYLQLTGKIKTQSGNIYVSGTNIKQYGGSIQSTFGNISLRAEKKITLLPFGKVTSLYGGIVMEAQSIKIGSKVKAGTVELNATLGSINGKGSVTANDVSLQAYKDIGSSSDPFNIDAGTLAALTKTGNIYLDEASSVRAGQVDQLYLGFGVPDCANGMPVAFAPTISGVDANSFLSFNVHGDLSGNKVEAGGNANVTVGGSVNGLDLLQAGDNIDLNVNGSYQGGDIIAGNDLNAHIGSSLRFKHIKASTVNVHAGSVYMSQVNAGHSATFIVRGSVYDAHSMVTSPTITIDAGGDIGPNAPIQLNVGQIELIRAQGDVAIVQNRPGGTPVNLIDAGGELFVGVPNGGLIDGNGDAVNIRAADATVDAQFLGTLDDPLEIVIEPGNLKMSSAGLSDADTGEGYIFVHVDGTIGDGGAHHIEYIGAENIPGLIIFNDRVVGGPDNLVARFRRGDAFLTEECPVIERPEGWLGQPMFVSMTEPGTESWEIFVHYILRDQAQITGDSEMPEDATRTVKIGDSAMLYPR